MSSGIKTFLLFTGAAAMLGGCAVQSGSEDNVVVSAKDAFLYNEKLTESLLADYDLVRKVTTQISAYNIFDEALQPVNKKEKCLLPFMVSHNSDRSFYWDGDCHNGVASGFGRAVRLDGGIKSGEFLFEIDPDNPQRLITYLYYDLNDMTAEVGYSEIELKDGTLHGSSMTMGYSPKSWSEGSFELTYRYEDTSALMSHTLVQDLLNSESSYIVAYPNFSKDLRRAKGNVLVPFESTYRIVEGREAVGFSFIRLKDGRLLIRDNATGSDVALTGDIPELTAMTENMENEVRDSIDRNEHKLDQGMAAVERYVKEKCGKHQGLFRGDEISHICDFTDEFALNHDMLLEAKERYNDRIELYIDNQKERLERLEKHIKSLPVSSAK